MHITVILLQDIANYTRVVPQARQEIFKKFVERVNSTEKVIDLGWYAEARVNYTCSTVENCFFKNVGTGHGLQGPAK